MFMPVVDNWLPSHRSYMLDLLYRAWVVIVGWFHPDMAHGVFWGSLLVTFVASVMGKDQQQRLDQGKFGLAAGTSLGGLSGLIDKQSGLLSGRFRGFRSWEACWVGFITCSWHLWWWAFQSWKALSNSRLAAWRGYRSSWMSGLRRTLRAGFDAWTEKFSRMMADAKGDLSVTSRWC